MKTLRILLILLILLSLGLLCYISLNAANLPVLKLWSFVSEKVTIPNIFLITPTYTRLVQKAELTRLSHTFRQVPALHWIVVEDAPQKTQLVANFLQNSGIPYTHLCVQTMEGVTKARGTFQRNLGLSWLRETFYLEDAPEGVVYFADDDNTYSLEIFEEILVWHTRTESPSLRNDNNFTDINVEV